MTDCPNCPSAPQPQVGTIRKVDRRQDRDTYEYIPTRGEIMLAEQLTILVVIINTMVYCLMGCLIIFDITFHITQNPVLNSPLYVAIHFLFLPLLMLFFANASPKLKSSLDGYWNVPLYHVPHAVLNPPT